MLTKQRLSFKDKSANDYAWAKKTIDLITQSFTLDTDTVKHYQSEYHRMLSNYQLFNNRINQSDFERLCNPLGINAGQLVDEVQPYNKAANKIQTLLGEELKRPFNFKVALVNQSGIQSKQANKTLALRSYILRQLSDIQNLPPDFLEDALPEEEVKRILSTKFLSSKEITASAILNYLTKELSLKDLKNEAFKHALITSREIVKVSSYNDQPYLEVLNPLGVFYSKSSDVKYIQDGDYAGYRSYMSVTEILDKYGDYISDSDIKKLESQSIHTTGLEPPSSTISYGHAQDPFLSNSPTLSTQVLVQTVEWRSFRKVGFLTYLNDAGDSETIIVSEDYPLPEKYTTKVVTKDFNRKCTYYLFKIGNEDYALEYKWIPEIWTGTKIAHDIYAKIGPSPFQFRRHDDPTDVSLSIFGLVYNSSNAEPVSLMDRMKPFLYLYFIVMHKLKKLVAQDNGRIFHFDTSMVDPQIGLEKTLYYLKELNIDFYNPLQNANEPGVNQRGKVHASTDMSTTQNVLNYIQLLNYVDMQISDVAGVSKQREGQITPGEAVSNAQANVVLSSVITEIYFHAHDKLWEKILSALLSTTQTLWKGKSITKQYVLDDLSLATLAVTPSEFENEDFGIYVVSSAKEDELFYSLRSLADRLLQTQAAKISDIIKIYKSSSMEEIESMITESEESRMEKEAQQLEAQRQHEQQLLQQQIEADALAKEREYEHDIRLAEIESFKFVKEQDSNNNSIPDQLEIEKFKVDTAFRAKELDLKEKALQQKAINKTNG